MVLPTPYSRPDSENVFRFKVTDIFTSVKTTDKIIVLNTLIFIFPESENEGALQVIHR